jgi:protein TonB
MNERKSWRWIVSAYGGVLAVVVLIKVFVMHTASHEGVVLSNGAATPTPTVVDVFNGIRSDPVSPWIHAKHVAEASPTPVPSPSGSPGASPTPHAKSVVAVAKHPKHAGRHSAGEAEDGGSTQVAMAAEHTNSAPVQLAQVPPAIEHAAAPPTDAPTAAPVVATAAPQPAEDPNAPVYEPQRVVDAQVRVAAQPDFPEIERQRGAHGTSVVLVTIDPKGNVVNASIGSSSGYPGLDRAAIAAARASQFVAPRINGHPATETYRVVYDFSP